MASSGLSNNHILFTVKPVKLLNRTKQTETEKPTCTYRQDFPVWGQLVGGHTRRNI